MLSMLKGLEDTFAAVAYAEADEGQEAMRMAGVKECGGVSDAFAAAAFAEANCPDQARELMGCAPRRLAPTPQVGGFLESVGLGGVSVAYGLAEA